VLQQQAAALLLTTAPVQTLSDEIIRISALAPHFSALNLAILHRLRADSHANQLRTTLVKFNDYIDTAAEQMRVSLFTAAIFYAHEKGEITAPRDGYSQLTKERVATLLEPKFQEDAVKRARAVAEQVANAASIVRKVLPLLPQLKTELDEYVKNYLDRVSTRERRKGSWIRSFMDSVFGDPVAPTPLKPAEVSALPQHLSDGANLLDLLPAFFDTMELHFRRLSEIRSEQVFDLGYTTTEDLTRLYQDRLICITILQGMGRTWTPVIKAFSSPTKKKY
jgi:hypothetical protein